jgi:signal peptidase I
MMRKAEFAILVATFVAFLPTILAGLGYRFVYIKGNSMYPTLMDGDLVLVRKGNFSVGDVVCARVWNETVMHRVFTIEKINGMRYVCTRGDSINSTTECFPDSFVLYVGGKNPVRIPLIGNLYRIIDERKRG